MYLIKIIKKLMDTKNNTGSNNTGYRNSGDRNSGDYNSGDYNSGDYNSGDYNSGDYNSGYRNSGDYNSGDYNSGDRNSGDYNSGDYNSGDYNSGDYNSGWFNTDEPKMRMFNKDTDMTYSQFCEKFNIVYPDLKVCSWINSNKMTEIEKKEITGWEQMGWYLKTLTYQEAWAEYWGRASEDDKKFFLNLPNFDADIFKEITGIDVKENSKKAELLKKAQELIEKAEELKREAEKI